MKIVCMALVLAFSGAPARAQEVPAGEEYEARLVAVKGDVTVFTSEEPEGGPGEADMPLQKGDRIKTGPNSRAEIVLSGEHGLILNSSSEFALSSLARADAELGLSLGSLLANVQKLAAGAFRVRTPSAVAAVRGTEFGVEVTPSAQTYVGVFDEGRVEVRGDSGGPELLKSNQETAVSRGRAPRAAFVLRRLASRRRAVRSFRSRLSELRRDWRPLPPEQRLRARREMHQRLRVLRQQRLESLEKRRQGERPGQRPLREDQKRMQKRKEEIRRRLKGRR